MNKSKNKKNKNNIYVLFFFFILCLTSLIFFKETNFSKCLISKEIEKLKLDDNFNLNDQINHQEDKFIISLNKEDLIEKQKTISIEESGNLN